MEKPFVKDILPIKEIVEYDRFDWQAAWRAIEKDRDLRTFFERLYPRTGKKRAIVAVARKLIGRIRAAFKTGQLDQMNSLSGQEA